MLSSGTLSLLRLMTGSEDSSFWTASSRVKLLEGKCDTSAFSSFCTASECPFFFLRASKSLYLGWSGERFEGAKEELFFFSSVFLLSVYPIIGLLFGPGSICSLRLASRALSSMPPLLKRREEEGDTVFFFSSASFRSTLRLLFSRTDMLTTLPSGTEKSFLTG